MLILTTILSLGFLCATGKPSQLRLSHSGYEIISFNENSGDDSILGTRNSSEHETDFLNLEKVSDTLNDNDDISTGLQQHKHHYESQKSNTESKAASEPRRNAIDNKSKESLNSINRQANLLLTLGIPRRFINPKNQRIYSESNIKSKNFFDHPNHNQFFWNQNKLIPAPVHLEIKDKKYNAEIKPKIKLFPFDFVSESNPEDDKLTKILESEQESEESMNKIKSFVFEATDEHDFGSFPAIDSTESNVKSGNFVDHANHHRGNTNQEKFISTSINLKIKDDNGYTKSKIKNVPLVFEKESNHEDDKTTKAPEAEQESLANLSKIKVLVVDAHRGFDFSFDKADSEEKSEKFEAIYDELALPMILGISRRFINHENKKKDSSNIFSMIDNPESNIKSTKFPNDANHERFKASYVNSKIKDNAAINKKVKSIPFVFKQKLNHENDKTAKNMKFSQKSVPNLNKIKALVLDAHHGFDFSIGKTDSEEKFDKFETIYTKSRFPILRFPSIAIHNQRSFWLPPKNPAMFSPIYPSGLNLLPSNSHKKSIFPFNVPSALKNTRNVRFDSKNPTSRKITADMSESRIHEIHNFNRPLDTNLSRKKCDKMKNFATPHFYDFLTKFSDIVIDNALQYEKNVQIHDSAVKMIELSRRKSTEDETPHFI